MRSLVIAVVALCGAGCLWSSGPDCAGACDKLLNCPGVQGTFLLSCGSVNGDCYDAIATCAQCIEGKDCVQLGAGACDSVCRVATDAGP